MAATRDAARWVGRALPRASGLDVLQTLEAAVDWCNDLVDRIDVATED